MDIPDEDIEVIAISSNADDETDGIKMETIEVHEEDDDDTMTIDKSTEAAMQILNGLNPMAINPLLSPHLTGNIRTPYV